jgi:hypothetical protein
MADAVSTQLIAAVARDQVAQVAPQELVLFRAQSAAYFADPDRAPQTRAGKEEMLGFGVGEAAVLLTPVILRVSKEVVAFLAEQVQKSLATQTPGLVDDLVKSLFKRLRPASGPAPAATPLTTAQLAQVRRLALEKAQQDGLAEPQAALLADSIVGGLVVAS